MEVNHNYVTGEINVTIPSGISTHCWWDSTLVQIFGEPGIKLNRKQGPDPHLIKCGVKHNSLSKLMHQEVERFNYVKVIKL